MYLNSKSVSAPLRGVMVERQPGYQGVAGSIPTVITEHLMHIFRYLYITYLTTYCYLVSLNSRSFVLSVKRRKYLGR